MSREPQMWSWVLILSFSAWVLATHDPEPWHAIPSWGFALLYLGVMWASERGRRRRRAPRTVRPLALPEE